MDSRLALVAIVALALLAGCSFQADSTASESELTPAEVPTVGNETPPSPTLELPDSYRGDASSASDLASDHGEALANRTYRVRESLVWTSTGAEEQNVRTERNGTTWYHDRRVVSHERTRIQEFLQEPIQRRVTNTSTFRIDDDRLVRTETNGSVSYNVVPADTLSGRVHDNTSRAVDQLLRLQSASTEPIRWDNETHILITGEGSDHSVFGLVHNYSARAVVRPDGLVRRLTVFYEKSGLGRHRTYEYSLAIDVDVPDRIERPEWTETALNRTSGAD